MEKNYFNDLCQIYSTKKFDYELFIQLENLKPNVINTSKKYLLNFLIDDKDKKGTVKSFNEFWFNKEQTDNYDLIIKYLDFNIQLIQSNNIFFKPKILLEIFQNTLIENEYMRKKNEESKRKNKEEIKLIKEKNDNYEKYIKDKINEEREKIYDSNMIKKTDYENNNKTIYQKHFFPKLYQNPENVYLIENLKKREKQKMKKFYDKKNKNEERILNQYQIQII